LEVSERSLEEVGLGAVPRLVMYGLALLPFVGVVMGLSYMVRRNQATRQWGQRLLWYSVFVHLVYLLCVCPAATVWVLAG